MSKEIAVLPYHEVNFKFISNHHDFHLGGTCIYNNSLCDFVCKYPNYDEDKDDYDEVFATIYTLSFKEKIHRRFQQWLFEQCVGYHWSYKNGKIGANFKIRNPKWLYQKLYNLYFKR